MEAELNCIVSASTINIRTDICIYKEEQDEPDCQDAPVNTVVREDPHDIHAQNMIRQNERDAHGNELYEIRTVKHHAQAHTDDSGDNP